MKTPEPKPTAIVCSVCGLEWKRHGKTPTLEKCIELLKAEVARKPIVTWAGTSPTFFQQTG